MLYKKSFVNKWLLKHFREAEGKVYLFYTGHSHRDGNWAIET